MKKYLFFDLDGTISDSSLGIVNACQYALGQLGIEEPDRESLLRFIGPPLIDSFQEYYGFDYGKAKDAVKLYREYYRQGGLYENTMYEGIPEMLEELQKKGYHIIMATSKPQEFAELILKHFGIYDRFELVSGAGMDGTRDKKAHVIEYALKQLNIRDVAEVLMIGDREHDVLGAAEFGIECMGVLYGFGNEAEFESAGAKYMVQTVEDIVKKVEEIS